jgi:WG containing repeat
MTGKYQTYSAFLMRKIQAAYKVDNTVFGGSFIGAIDAQNNRKLIFLQTGEVIDFPFNYSIVGSHPKSRVILVKDTAKVSYGVVSTKGKVLIPCVNYAVAISDPDKSVFFVKRDTPHFKEDRLFNNFAFVNMDSLNEEDKNWMMYNADGQFIGTFPFRFPIDFKQGVGVGVQGEDFNLYKTDGSILTPFYANGKPINEQSYNNIWRVKPTDYYALFRNRGLTPTMTLADRNGQILVESGRYDGISRFYGKYALVKSSGMVGLIDSFGHEIIAPIELSMSQIPFMDSIEVYNKELIRDKKDDYTYLDKLIELPINFIHEKNLHPDSLHISPFYRTALLNLMLQKSIDNTIATAKNNAIPRVINLVRAANIYGDISGFTNEFNTLTRVSIGDSTIAFGWVTLSADNFVTHNFKRRNGRWEELKINDLLNIRGEKYLLFNDYLTRKIKALKDASIDCSNSNSFLKQVENRFMLTDKGIDFCFESTDGLGGGLVVVSFTWDELKAYLK